jgi:chorismate mutase
MTQTAESVLKSLLELPEADRCEIMDRVSESLWNTQLNAEDAAAWQSFLEERIAAADRGDLAAGSAFDVVEEIRRELAQEPR